MKVRIASSIVLAASLMLGASGCSLFASVSTLKPYAPSDGIDTSIAGVDVRNLLLIENESGTYFNVVFTGVNNGESPVNVRFNFVEDGAQLGAADFTLEQGVNRFGDPAENAPVLVALPDAIPGSMVTVYIQSGASAEVQREVPILDGTLAEYTHLVLPDPVAEDSEDN